MFVNTYVLGVFGVTFTDFKRYLLVESARTKPYLKIFQNLSVDPQKAFLTVVNRFLQVYEHVFLKNFPLKIRRLQTVIFMRFLLIPI